jgi:hypothetical protein
MVSRPQDLQIYGRPYVRAGMQQRRWHPERLQMREERATQTWAFMRTPSWRATGRTSGVIIYRRSPNN